MLRCRKCGAAVISEESMIQSVLDLYEDAVKRAKYAQPKKRSAALAEAAEYKAMYKALMHNISNKDYAEAVIPYILHALVEEIKARKLLSEEEIAACYEKGRKAAEIRKQQAEKGIRRIYGETVNAPKPAYKDPTGDTAAANVDRERRKNNAI